MSANYNRESTKKDGELLSLYSDNTVIFSSSFQTKYGKKYRVLQKRPFICVNLSKIIKNVLYRGTIQLMIENYTVCIFF